MAKPQQAICFLFAWRVSSLLGASVIFTVFLYLPSIDIFKQFSKFRGVFSMDLRRRIVLERTDVLTGVIEIWSQAIGETVYADSHYVDLGGDSLIALEIIVRVNQRFHVNLPFSSFQHLSTPMKIAQWIIDRNHS